MKNLCFLLCFIVFTTIAFTQAKPKPAKPQEKPPTQKEMDEMIKEMENLYKNMTPEEKRMFDSMGVKMPNSKSTPRFTDKQYADAWNDEGKVVPAKKTALIAALPKTILTNTELAAFIKRINLSVESKLMPKSKQLANAVITQYRNDKNYGGMVAAAANGMWVLGLKEPAVYLMGKAIEVMPNADNYNNYAAYLTMTGAAHIAIPVLEKLNSIHKNNSTITNNLAHAWLELGDEAKADKYLDETIVIYPFHPQANYTKAVLLEAKGKTKEAIAAVKRSLKHSVTKNKLAKLRKLENDKTKIYNFHIPKTYFSTTYNPARYLNNLPDSYAATAGLQIEKKWIAYKEELQDEIRRLDAAIAANKKRVEADVKDIDAKNKKYGRPSLSPYYIRTLATRGKAMGMDDHMRITREEADAWSKYITEWSKLKNDFQKELTKTKDDIERNAPNNSDLLYNNCPVILPIVNKHVKQINFLNQKYRNENLRKWMTNAFSRYNYLLSVAVTESDALQGVLELKRDFVTKLLSLKHESYDLPECVKEEEPKNKLPFVKGNFTDFDQVTCKTKSTLYVPFTGQITIRCNRMDVVFNPMLIPVNTSFTSQYYGNNNVITEASIGITVKGVDLNIEGAFDREGNFESGNVSIGKEINGVEVSVKGEFNADGFKKGSIELGIDDKMSLLPKEITEAAPVELGMKGELAVGLEVGPEGIEDWYVKEKTNIDMGASAEADLGDDAKQAIEYTNELAKGLGMEKNVNIPEPKVSTGASVSAENRWGVNSGYTVERSGEFSWLK